MKKVGWSIFFTLALAAVTTMVGYAGEKKAKAPGKSVYLIEVSHTPEECLKALEEVSAKSSDLLAQFDWGCMVGDHRGWAAVKAESETAARDLLPVSQRDKAKIVKVTKFTPEQLKAAHQGK